LNFTHHAGEFLGIFFAAWGVSRLGNDPDIDLRLVRFDGYDGLPLAVTDGGRGRLSVCWAEARLGKMTSMIIRAIDSFIWPPLLE
jgi:hypothetical protein